MLSADEQRAWDEIQRLYAEQAEEPARAVLGLRRPGSRKTTDLPAAVIAGGWTAVMLIVFGALVAGSAIGAATALGWLLWRYWPLLGGDVGPFALPATRDALVDGGERPSPEEPRHRRHRHTPGTT